MGGHFGADKTYNILSDKFFWPHMLDSVRDYVKKCNTCQRAKPSNEKPVGLLMPLPMAEGRWQRIGIDFITP